MRPLRINASRRSRNSAPALNLASTQGDGRHGGQIPHPPSGPRDWPSGTTELEVEGLEVASLVAVAADPGIAIAGRLQAIGPEHTPANGAEGVRLRVVVFEI